MTAIGNARRFLDVSSEFGTFDDDIWRLVGGKPKAALTVASPPAADAGQMVRGAATASHRKTASDRLGNVLLGQPDGLRRRPPVGQPGVDGGGEGAAGTVAISGIQPWRSQEMELPPAAEHVDRLAFDVQVPSLQDHPGTPDTRMPTGESHDGARPSDPLNLPGRSPPLFDDFSPDPFPRIYGPQ